MNRRHAMTWCLVAAAGLAAPVLAQQSTRIIFEARNETQSTGWSSTVDARHGETVRVRLGVVFVGTQTVTGFAGTTLQPTISNFLGTDTYGVLETMGGVPPSIVDDQPRPGSNGRVAPFHTGAPMTPPSPAGVLTAFRDAGNVLRFAGANSTGPTSNHTRGVGMAQKTRGLLGAGVFNPSNSPFIFTYSFTIGPDHVLGDVMQTNAVGINLNRGTWFGNPDSGTGNPVNATISGIANATITIVPAPGGTFALACGVAWFCSRRGRPSLGANVRTPRTWLAGDR